ncbi:hypothetical protein N7468_010780 [Penicillium chermesinum]|uniref:Uncharacterized protein n=1 Tax=Penicillium chermesinum TaxID=63820 RepID=A0A9W9N8F3_9EURO|nr:uncharacterized protein N7468_010780 [Penicillium chermesinum]KAJ5215101.1 hypothetical protein N7468_010780 [Penicillium chermesinum]KAJ6141409.1 hypothetical protein N7470_009799 [Penicillium chermesinum]
MCSNITTRAEEHMKMLVAQWATNDQALCDIAAAIRDLKQRRGEIMQQQQAIVAAMNETHDHLQALADNKFAEDLENLVLHALDP